MADKDKKANNEEKVDKFEKQSKSNTTSKNVKDKEIKKSDTKKDNSKKTDKIKNDNTKIKDEFVKKESFLDKLNFETKIIGLVVITILLTYVFYLSGRIGVLSLIKGVFLGTFGFVVITIPVLFGVYTYSVYKTKSFEINIVKLVYFNLASISLSMLLSSVFFNGDLSAVDSFYRGYETGSYLTFGFIATGVANLVTRLAGQGIAIIIFMMLTMLLVFFGFEKDFKEMVSIIKAWFSKLFKIEEDEDYKEFYNTKKHKLEDIEKRYNEEQEEKQRQEELKQEELRREELRREELKQEELKQEKLKEDKLKEEKRKEKLRQEQLELEEREKQELERRDRNKSEEAKLGLEEEKLREYRFNKDKKINSNSNQSSNVDEEDDAMKNNEDEVLNQEYVRYMREKKARKEQALKDQLDGKFTKENVKSKYVQKNRKLKGRDLRPMPKPKVFKVEPREEGQGNFVDNANKIVFNRDIFDARQQGVKLYDLVSEERQNREVEIIYDETKKINERLFNDSILDNDIQDDKSFIDNYINADSAIQWVKGQNVENEALNNNDYQYTQTTHQESQPQTNINVNINIDTNEELKRKQEKYLARTAVLDEVYNKVKDEIIEYFNDSTRDNFDFMKKPRVNANQNVQNQTAESSMENNTENNIQNTNQDTQQVEFTPNFIMQDSVVENKVENSVETSVVKNTENSSEDNSIKLEPALSVIENQANTPTIQLSQSSQPATQTQARIMASTDELKTFATNSIDSHNANNSNNTEYDDVSKEITEELKEEIKGEVKEKILKEFAERIFENMSQEDKEEFLLNMKNSDESSKNTSNTYRNYENAKEQNTLLNANEKNYETHTETHTGGHTEAPKVSEQVKNINSSNLDRGLNLGQPLNIQKSVDENDVKVYNINSGVDNHNTAKPDIQKYNQNLNQINTQDDDMKVYGHIQSNNPQQNSLQQNSHQQRTFRDDMGYEYEKKVENNNYEKDFVKDYDDDLYQDLALEEMYNEDEFDLDEIEKEYTEFANKLENTNSFSNANATQPQSKLKHIDTVATRNKPYEYPSVDILAKNTTPSTKMTDEEIKANSDLLEQTLSSFGVKVKVLNVTQGPTVTRYELQPGIGVKVSKIVGLADDLALNLAAQGIRIEAPIPGKSAVGIEVPNAERESIFFRDILENDEFLKHKSKIAVTLGKDISGKPVVADIGSMPHLLVAGATGSGKSVCINTLITSILYRATPEECKLLMIDPKVVELSIYNGIPHLMIPVVTDPKKACAALQWAVSEMEKRYEYFAEVSVRNLDGYNEYVKANNQGETLPKVVIIVDELADLMMTAGKEVEESICRLTQKARAAGIHLIVATQRPSVDVITGLIKANIPSRIAFSVSSGIDSRTILGEVGAEKLLGKGDMLFIPYGSNEQTRIQGAFISDKEVENIVAHLKETSVVSYDESIIDEITSGGSTSKGISQEDADELLNDAMDLFIERDKASISMLQTRFKVGYNRAARIIDTLESAGYIGEQDGSKGRKILISRSEWENIQG